MSLETIAARYAEALYDAAAEAGVEDEIGGELAELRRLWEEVPDLVRFFTHPSVSREEKERLARAITEGMHPYLTNLLLLLLSKGRAGLLPMIERKFLDTAEQKGKLLHIVLRSARDVPEGELTVLRKRLEEMTGKPVAISVEHAPELLAGGELVVRGRRLDASIQGRLARLAAELRG